MGKNKRSTYEVLDTRTNQVVSVDSYEEVDMWMWLLEATSLGIIKDFVYQPPSFSLSDSVTYKNSVGKDRCLFRPHIYTADFKITFDKKEYPTLADEFKQGTDVGNLTEYYIDVKGEFGRSDSRSFPINQKWVWEKHHVYVHKVIPKKFSEKFGVAKAARFTLKTNKPRRMYDGYNFIETMMKKNAQD